MATYDSRVAYVFQQQQNSHEGTTFGPIQCVGVLKEIILMDYGPISQLVVLFKCEWVENGCD
jgi:hypothetical protein